MQFVLNSLSQNKPPEPDIAQERDETFVVEREPAYVEEMRRDWPFLLDCPLDAYSPLLSLSHWLD